MRIDWIPWNEKSTKRIYPLYRKLFINNNSTIGTLQVFENENKEFSVYWNDQLIEESLSEEKATKICDKFL